MIDIDIMTTDERKAIDNKEVKVMKYVSYWEDDMNMITISEYPEDRFGKYQFPNRYITNYYSDFILHKGPLFREDTKTLNEYTDFTDNMPFKHIKDNLNLYNHNNGQKIYTLSNNSVDKILKTRQDIAMLHLDDMETIYPYYSYNIDDCINNKEDDDFLNYEI